MEQNKAEQKFQDIKCKCVDCQNEFTFTAGEQRMYQEKGLYPPKRCPTCRLLRKQKNEQKQQAQNTSN